MMINAIFFIYAKFNFSYLCKVEKVLFRSQIFEMNILMDLHVLRSSECENHLFSSRSVGVNVCVRLYVCVSVISIVQKQSAGELETLNLVFFIYTICRCYLKLFKKIGQKLFVQGVYKRILIYYGLRTEFLDCEFSYIYTTVNIMEFTYMFDMVKNM